MFESQRSERYSGIHVGVVSALCPQNIPSPKSCPLAWFESKNTQMIEQSSIHDRYDYMYIFYWYCRWLPLCLESNLVWYNTLFESNILHCETPCPFLGSRDLFCCAASGFAGVAKIKLLSLSQVVFNGFHRTWKADRIRRVRSGYFSEFVGEIIQEIPSSRKSSQPTALHAPIV